MLWCAAAHEMPGGKTGHTGQLQCLGKPQGLFCPLVCRWRTNFTHSLQCPAVRKPVDQLRRTELKSHHTKVMYRAAQA